VVSLGHKTQLVFYARRRVHNFPPRSPWFSRLPHPTIQNEDLLNVVALEASRLT